MRNLGRRLGRRGCLVAFELLGGEMHDGVDDAEECERAKDQPHERRPRISLVIVSHVRGGRVIVSH